MNDSPTPSKAARWVGAAGLLAAGAIGGAIVASSAAASAGTLTTDASTSYSSSASGETGANRPGFPAHGSAAHEDQEKPVTGTNATKAQDAAVKAVGSGTAGAVTTDMTGSGYEVTVAKADGSTVEVHLNSSFAVQNNGPVGRPGDGPANG